MKITGSIYQTARKLLEKEPFFSALKSGKITLGAFEDKLFQQKQDLIQAGLTEDDVQFCTRLPENEERTVDEILRSLVEHGVIASASYPKDEFERFRAKVQAEYDHGGRSTFIAPEEERLIYAVSSIVKPTAMLNLGSYYGYWGIWTLPALKASGGSAIYVDPNPDVNAIALCNLDSFGFADRVRIVPEDGCDFIAREKPQHDLALLDAECALNHPNPAYRGKAIYSPLVRAASPLLRPGGLLVCHNILLKHAVADPYFEQKICDNYQTLAPFLAHVGTHFRLGLDFATTEGVGAYVK